MEEKNFTNGCMAAMDALGEKIIALRESLYFAEMRNEVLERKNEELENKIVELERANARLNQQLSRVEDYIEMMQMEEDNRENA